MQTLFDDATKKRALLSSGLSMLLDNKRYIFWFWFLNLTLAEFGTAAFRRSAHALLDNSLYAARVEHGLPAAVVGEMLAHPAFGPMQSATMPAFYFSFLFFVATALFLPGVYQGYASAYRLPREDFFRACGRNLWRFIRLMIVAGIVMGIVAGLLFFINGAIGKKVAESTNELLPFELNVTGLAVIFLVMTMLRIWFDLAEADVVLNDQRAVRKSIAAAFRHTFRRRIRLLVSYVVVAIVAAIILAAGLWLWMRFVKPENVIGAFLIGQLTLFLLLIPRFWQRGMAVSYWQGNMLVPVVANQFVAATPSAVPLPTTAVPVETEPVAAPLTAGVPEITGAAPETPTGVESTSANPDSSKAEPQ